MYEPLIPAQPTVNEHGVAQHPDYGDVYHSLSGALGQTDYVFLGGNGLPQRWQNRAQFTICETGFGLGNNFLATWHRWRSDPERCRRLHFVSFEAHPLGLQDLEQQLARSAEILQPLAQQLLAVWPALLPGVHRLEFEQGQLTLTLVFGRIEQTARQVELRADAFFLDGFSPRLNPDMWTRSVFKQLVRVAAPAATLATWCTASAVRQDLQDVGFILQKRAGFGYKREMLMGRLRPHLGRLSEPVKALQAVAVVGGGITGAAVSHALAQRGIAVQVFDPAFARGCGAAHRGHHAVAMRPLVGRGDPPRARLSRLGIALARQRWAGFLHELWYPAPALQLAQDEEQGRLWQQMLAQLAFDPAWLQWQDAHQAAQFLAVQAPYGGLRFAEAYVARPEPLIAALLDHRLISLHAEAVCGLEAVETQGWRLHAERQTHEAQAVVLANAAGVRDLLAAVDGAPGHPKLQQAGIVSGQVGSYAAPAHAWPGTKILGAAGYALNDRQGHVVLGSSYERGSRPNAWSASKQNLIEQKLRPYAGGQLPAHAAAGGWVGQRLALRDHRPVIGPVGNAALGLWVAAAMGSYGFSWACVAAEQIAAQMSQEPHILTLDLQRAVALR